MRALRIHSSIYLGVLLIGTLGLLQAAEIPEGFTSIFNHANIAGWHTSMTSHHGNTTEWRITDGVLTSRQRPAGNGGILLTDDRYGDFELYLEIKPDYGCDGGLFLRSNANGQAYQVMLDYRDGGNVGGVYGERLKGVKTTNSEGWEAVWRKDDWNELRVRMEGEAPAHHRLAQRNQDHRVSRHGEPYAAGGARDGMIGLQVHGGSGWVEGGFHRYRNIAVKKLN